jgi:hypothetical protein
MADLAGIDFFTVEVLTWRGLATYYVLFFLHPETRRVTIAGITQHPTGEWMVQMARNAVDVIDGTLLPSNDASVWRSSADSAAASQPKSECVRRAMDPLHQARVLVEVGPLW